MNNTNTIYALSTAYGKSGVAVFRISGKNCKKIIKKITKIREIKDRKPILTKIFENEKKKKPIDRCMITYFKGPKSYTGEDCIEISIHGSPAVINSLYMTLEKTGLCKEAERGEFTRRAFENNKIDLTQVEAVSDLINAQTESQRMQALSHLDGKFSKIIKLWSAKIRNILANAEALIDFGDEELPKKLLEDNKKKIKKLAREIDRYLDDKNIGEVIRSGLKIAVIGRPNTGKSSLINYLAKRKLSIVSNIPGTTRDLIELNYDIRGIPVIFYDTAGIRKSSKKIESYGIKKSLEKSKESNLTIIIVNNLKEVQKYNKLYKNSIFVQSKIDKKIKMIKSNNVLKISSITGQGVDKMINRIFNMVKISSNSYANPYVSRERHRKLLENCSDNLKRSLKLTQLDIMAEEIRSSYINISKIYGKYDIEEVLDEIFNDFCIGK